MSAQGAATLTNLQRNVNSAVYAANFGSMAGILANSPASESGNITASTLSVAGNTQEAIAVGSGASNSLSLAGHAVGTGAGISSVQSSDAASAVFADVGGAAAVVSVYTGVVDSHLAVTDNLQRAIAYGNSIANTINVSAHTTSVDRALDGEGDYIPTTSVAFDGSNAGGSFSSARTAAGYALLNQQLTQAGVTASSNTGGMYEAPPAATLTVEGSLGNSSARNDANALVAAAYGNDASNGMTLNLGQVNVNNASVAALSNLQMVSGADTVVSATAGGGTAVRTSLLGDVLDSAVSSTGNLIQALAYGNRITSHQLSVTALNVAGSGVMGVLSNLQQVSGAAPLSSTVFGSFAIDVAEGTTIENSSLSVSGNSQRASATGNTAANAVTLSGTNVAASSALLSVQGGHAAIDASSTMEVFAPMFVSGSTVSLTDNSNSALAVANDVVNTLSVSAANLAAGASGLDFAPSGYAVAGPGMAFGNHVVNNLQTADAAVSSLAATALYNKDAGVAAASGLSNGSASISGNSTLSEATANRASNALVLNGTASLGTSAALGNFQTSAGTVIATAGTSAAISLSTEFPLAQPLNQGNLALTGNTTLATARGNTAVNALNASGRVSEIMSPALAGSTGGGQTQAGLVLQNSQINSAGVSASSTDASYRVALNSGAFQGPANNANNANNAITVSGNTLVAQAVGNSAANSMTIALQGNNTPTAAVSNYQMNSGAVTARATSVTYNIDSTGGMVNSTLRTSANQVTATAIGNSAVSSLQSVR